MALLATQLGAAITANQTLFALTSGSLTGAPQVGALPLPMGVPIQIDGEIMFWIAQPSANMCQVRGRGSDGTAAIAHDILANVYVGALPGDFPLPPPNTMVTIDVTDDTGISLGQDQTITPATSNTAYNINKATAAALTILAPNLSDNGVTLAFTSNTAAAHTLTTNPTGLIQDASGVVHSTATFTATKGAAVVFMIENGFYNVLGTALGVTFS